MVKKGSARHPASDADWAARIAALDAPPPAARVRKEPLTVDRIVTAALEIVRSEGYDELTMRRVAIALTHSPGALYAHVRDKGELDELMFARLCGAVAVVQPDPSCWLEQAIGVCGGLRDQYLRYPGISQVAVANAPHSIEALQLNEGLLAILLSGGVTPQAAGWATDAAFLYISAYSLIAPRRQGSTDDGSKRDEIVARYQMLPRDRFPNTITYARELTSGGGHDRFNFALTQLFGNLTPPGD